MSELCREFGISRKIGYITHFSGPYNSETRVGEGIRTLDPNLGKQEIMVSQLDTVVLSSGLEGAGVHVPSGMAKMNRGELGGTKANCSGAR